jgi:hypothetical protein
VSLVALVACGKSHSSTGSHSTQFIITHNAQFNDGKTVRWASLPIVVALNGLASPDEVTAWTGATHNAVTFAFVGAPISNGVNLRGTSRTDICGLTTVEYGSDGRIASADVSLAVAVYHGPQCVRTVTHEIGHAIGFLNHTADGGLMDPDGGNGQFTTEVTETIEGLYSLAVGTDVGLGLRPQLGLRSPGRRTMVFVTYPKRP